MSMWENLTMAVLVFWAGLSTATIILLIIGIHAHIKENDELQAKCEVYEAALNIKDAGRK